MRPLEALFTGALFVSLVMRWLQPRNRQLTATIFAMNGILLALHLVFDGIRWEMIPAYLMALAGAWIWSADLRHATDAKAGESSRWRAVPSIGKRVATGALLGVMSALAVVLPLWAFPRILLPQPDGLYDVGRMDLDWADSTRNLASGTPRPITATVWYPAESPNGRPLKYHPQPGALGSGLAAGTPFPGFTFRNLTAARTHSTSSPRFSIREGRSPLVLVSHDAGASRMEGTSLFERLASRGYVVVSVQHALSAVGAVLPGGETLPVQPGDAGAEITARTGDLRFVLDRINALPAGGAIDTLVGHLRLDRVAVIGRGLGGSAAAEAAATDPRITAGAAIAPDTVGEAAARGVRRAFLVFTVSDPGTSLDGIFRYGGTEVRLGGASRSSLSDLALLGTPIIATLGIVSEDDPRDIHAAVSALTLRFLDQYLKERREETEVDLPARVKLEVIPHRAR